MCFYGFSDRLTRFLRCYRRNQPLCVVTSFLHCCTNNTMCSTDLMIDWRDFCIDIGETLLMIRLAVSAGFRNSHGERGAFQNTNIREDR